MSICSMSICRLTVIRIDLFYFKLNSCNFSVYSLWCIPILFIDYYNDDVITNISFFLPIPRYRPTMLLYTQVYNVAFMNQHSKRIIMTRIVCYLSILLRWSRELLIVTWLMLTYEQDFVFNLHQWKPCWYVKLIIMT